MSIIGGDGGAAGLRTGGPMSVQDESSRDDRADARALWSPDGKTIAWRHYFTSQFTYDEATGRPAYCGVGLAQLRGEGWDVKPLHKKSEFVTPLAWSPEEPFLLCAQFHDERDDVRGASLFLMDAQFRRVPKVKFTKAEKALGRWTLPEWEFAHLGDWAILPRDVALPPIRPLMNRDVHHRQ